jgi:hypothetical protein
MEFLKQLELASKNTDDLVLFISDNYDHIYNLFLCTDYKSFESVSPKIEAYINNHLTVFKSLPIEKKENLLFLLLLLETCERNEYYMPFGRLYSKLKKADVNIPHRYTAAALSIIKVRQFEDHFNRVDEVMNNYIQASDYDDDNLILTSFINYYIRIVRDFGDFNNARVLNLREKLLQYKNENQVAFLHHEITSEIFSDTDFSDKNFGDENQLSLDILLKRKKIYVFGEQPKLLIENGTEYSSNIASLHSPSFYTFRDASITFYNKISNSNQAYYSLNKGVAIIEEFDQLYTYLYSYGKMHIAKLTSAFQTLLQENLSEITIVDWACGQGIGTCCLFDFIKENQLEIKINKVHLIEPSELAIKRACLHVSQYINKEDIVTINKDLDSLLETKLTPDSKHTIHILSNILDIDSFNLIQFIDYIKSNYRGENLFICVSPYISLLRNARLDRFMNGFMTNEKHHKVLLSVENPKGQWINGWSRNSRVFKASI